jgi:hypothetical protein
MVVVFAGVVGWLLVVTTALNLGAADGYIGAEINGSIGRCHGVSRAVRRSSAADRAQSRHPTGS